MSKVGLKKKKKKKYVFDIPEQFLCFKLIYMLQSILNSASPTNPSRTKKNVNFLIDKNSVGNRFCTFKLSVTGGGKTKSERPNFLRLYLPRGGGEGGSRNFGQCLKCHSFFLMASLS